jgi:mevalonate kinase
MKESAELLPEALRALESRDVELLGETVRRSYSLMHGAILGAQPPMLYWLPATVAVIHACESMRAADVERLLEEAASAGALGAKLSGAGGGGVVFAVSPDRDHAAFIASRMEAAAAEAGMVLASAFRVIEV